MALTEENELKVCKILGVEPYVLSAHLNLMDTTFTSTRQTAVEAELDRWDLKGAKFTKIKDYLGADIDPEREKDDIRKNIAILLEMPEWARSSSGATSRVQRG